MDAEELTQRARTCQGWLPKPLAKLVVDLGHADKLPRQVARGDWHAAEAWAAVLSERGGHESALEVLKPFLQTGWWKAAETTAKLLDGWDRTAEAVTIVEPFAAAGERRPVKLLTHLLVRLGRHDEAFERLRPRLDNVRFARVLAQELAGCGRDEEIIAILEGAVEKTADTHCVEELAKLYERQGRVDDAVTLLRTHFLSNGSYCVNHIEQLAVLLARHDRLDEANELTTGPAGDVAAQSLAGWHTGEEGDVGAALDVLGPFVQRGSANAAVQMAGIFACIDWVDAAIEVLRPLAREEGTNPYCAAPAYYATVAEYGQYEQGLALIDEIAGGGDTPTSLLWHRAELLRRGGRAEEALAWLRARPDADGRWVQSVVTGMLVALGRDEEVLARLLPAEERPDLVTAAEVLIRQGRIAEAMDLVHAWQNPKAPEGPWNP